MTDKEIIAAAQEAAKAPGHPVPPDLNVVELALFWGLYYVCKQYRDGSVTVQAAKKLKNDILTQYGQMKLSRQVYLETAKRRVRINVILDKAERDGCVWAKELRAVLEGR